jgi:hypothetical protein
MRLPQGHSAAGRIRSIEKSNYLIGNRTHDLPGIRDEMVEAYFKILSTHSSEKT